MITIWAMWLSKILPGSMTCHPISVPCSLLYIMTHNEKTMRFAVRFPIHSRWSDLHVTGMVKDDYSSTETSPSNEYSFQKQRQRPRYFHVIHKRIEWFSRTLNSLDDSHPLPKKLPLLRLVDQSNLWSGDQREHSWRPVGSEVSSASIVRPKVKNGGLKNLVDSPLLDHSIAVWEATADFASASASPPPPPRRPSPTHHSPSEIVARH